MLKRKIFILFFLIYIINTNAIAQKLVGLSARYNDSFVEWILYPHEEGVEGTLEQRWASQRDWTAWEYRFGDERGTIETKWRGDPSSGWVLRHSDGSTTEMTMLWRGDVGQWRISNHTHTFTLKARWSNMFDEWLVDSADYGEWTMWTMREGDPRDWDIKDELNDKIPFGMRLAAAFIVVKYSSPNY